MKGSIAAINQEAREHGMSYGKYLALCAAQQAPVGVGRRPDYEAGCSAGLGRWRHQLRAQRAPAPGREEETTTELKRSMPPGASLDPGWKSQQKIARVYGLSMEEIFRLLEEAGS